MRTIFVATGDIALPCFQHLIEHGPKPLALVTQPDKPVGRHQVLTSPKIKNVALSAGIEVLQPERIGDIAVYLSDLQPELIIVMAYGQILKENILQMASCAIINLHASLLPKYRGAACIQAPIRNGDEVSGVTSMHVVKGLDAGDVILRKEIEISPNETGGSLHDRLSILAVDVMAETIHQLSQGCAAREKQHDAESTYVGKLERKDGFLDWSQTAEAIDRQIRAYDPWPGTYTEVGDQGKVKRLKIFPPIQVMVRHLEIGQHEQAEGRWWVGCANGAIEIFYIQPEGGKRMSVVDYLRGKSAFR